MPVIRVEMFKRTQEQKKQLVKELTEAFLNTCGGDKEAIKILITEVEESNWSSGGILTSDKKISI
jgi:4-oxalocrotonate tautomerase